MPYLYNPAFAGSAISLYHLSQLIYVKQVHEQVKKKDNTDHTRVSLLSGYMIIVLMLIFIKPKHMHSV